MNNSICPSMFVNKSGVGYKNEIMRNVVQSISLKVLGKWKTHIL
jgi:hypothetical protein